jgi:predicted GIY-YIG superfamily endonuclease
MSVGFGSASHGRVMKFFYVYILQSENSAQHFYIGFTEDLQDRLKIHNAGSVPHTAKFVRGKLRLQLLSMSVNAP